MFNFPVIVWVVGRVTLRSLLAQRMSGSYVIFCFFNKIRSSSQVQNKALSVGRYPMHVFMTVSGSCLMVSMAVEARIMSGMVAGWMPVRASV